MVFDLNKDFIILNLLQGWEIIHLSKKGKNVIIRLREFPEKPTRFLRATFSKCAVAVVLDFNNRQTDDFSLFNFKGCIFSQTTIEGDGIISIHILRGNELVGALKIRPLEISFGFTSK